MLKTLLLTAGLAMGIVAHVPSTEAQQCVSGAQINRLVSDGAIRPVSALRVDGKIQRVEAVCRQGRGYVYVLVVQNGQQVSRVRVRASN